MKKVLLLLALLLLPPGPARGELSCQDAYSKLRFPAPYLRLTRMNSVGSGSTKPAYYVDENAVRWIGKRDSKFPELQTANEAIVSSIYRDLGYRAPSVTVVDWRGKRLAAIEELPFSKISPDLAHVNTPEFRELRFYAAWLKDWDRLNSLNNFEIGSDGFAIFDFGGALGSTAKGLHKPGKPFSPAIGTFENNLTGKEIFENFRVDKLSPDHAWRNFTREDVLNAARKLRAFSDEKIAQFVARGQYSKPADREYMIRALEQRRDALADYLEKELAPQTLSKEREMAQALAKAAANIRAERAMAVDLLRGHSDSFAGLFARTSGFSSVDEFRNTIRNGPALGAEILQKLENGGVEIALYRRAGRRDSVAQRGLLNIHSAATSGGQNSSMLRNRAEADMLGMPYRDYKALPNEVKPKSALLQPKPGDPIQRPINLMYGEDAYILRDEALKDRITLTPEDSLNRYIAGTGTTSEAPKRSHQITAWDQGFIPWEHRSLMTPYLIPDQVMWNKFNSSGTPYFFAEGNEDHFIRLRSHTPDRRLNISEKWGAHNQQYIEAQVWGPVNLDDVKAFQFTTHPPEGDFLEELLKRNIEIRDARDPNPSAKLNGEEKKSWSDHPIRIWRPGMP